MTRFDPRRVRVDIPLLTRVTHLVTRLDWSTAGLVTTFALGLGAAVAVWWMLHDLYGSASAREPEP